jgi:hypothetical protein
VFDLHLRSCYPQLQLHPVPAFADELGDVEVQAEQRTGRVRGRVEAHLAQELVAVVHNLVVVVCRSMVAVGRERETRPPLKVTGLQMSFPWMVIVLLDLEVAADGVDDTIEVMHTADAVGDQLGPGIFEPLDLCIQLGRLELDHLSSLVSVP